MRTSHGDIPTCPLTVHALECGGLPYCRPLASSSLRPSERRPWKGERSWKRSPEELPDIGGVERMEGGRQELGRPSPAQCAAFAPEMDAAL